MGILRNIKSALSSLSARLLVLTIIFVMLAEVLIFVPSVAFFRLNYLTKKTEFAHLAALSLLASPDNMVSEELREELLFRVGARSVALRSPNTKMLMLREDMPASVDASFDLSEQSPLILIEHALEALVVREERIVRIIAPIRDAPLSSIEVVIDEAPLVKAMLEYAGNIFWLSLVISVLTAVLVFLSLQWLMVRPMRRLSESMIAFRRSPEDITASITPSGRHDEIGTAERELEIMQSRLRFALKQKEHLAALGMAVSKISHDLRNILSTSHIVSDGLAEVDDPHVQKVVPRLVASIDRAIQLCTETLKFGKADERVPQRSRFPLLPLMQEVELTISAPKSANLLWKMEFDPDFSLYADREQFFRIMVNLCRNAAESLTGPGEITISARREGAQTVLYVRDTGPGIPARAMDHLFEPFTGSVKAGGTGLGLSIARELVTAHGGTIAVDSTSEAGTVFRLCLPDWK
ncbi:sensor histidine kinase [Sneathiella chinensis]|uniref:histidine kinase n=1 Tax=Sneathiella chinensis TaxID=349750 RepID=A0ABQ5U2P2_9PROT|nr:HAMP domain-containing sensor histidine kinase [Sneathiella chinensis]GLQ05455.1 ATPase [Sneathiella chinensis]